MDILAIGEPLMELSEVKDSQGQKVYLPGFGGDTSNFAVAAARSGVKVGYQTKVGNDTFGKNFLELWNKEGIDTSSTTIHPNAHTGLYFITYTKNGHEFTYLRKGSAASLLHPDDIKEEVIQNIKYLHVSGISQAISNSAADAVFKAIDLARKHHVKVSYDPNLRLKLWPLHRAKAIILATAKISNIFMPSLEEAVQLTGYNNPKDIIKYFSSFQMELVVLKAGKDGVYIGNQSFIEHIPGYQVETVDATGAGDTFDGAFIASLVKGKSYKEAAQYANAAAALSTTGHGAVNPIPYEDEVKEFLS